MAKRFVYFLGPDVQVARSGIEAQALRCGVRLCDVVVFQDQIEINVPALDRPQLGAFVSEKYKGKTLLVAELRCLGQNTEDVARTVDRMREMHIRIKCVEIHPNIDLAGKAGKPIMAAMKIMAGIVKGFHGARVMQGQAEAKARAGSLGRRIELSDKTRTLVVELLETGYSPSSAAKIADTNRWAVYRLIKRESIATVPRGTGKIAITTVDRTIGTPPLPLLV